MDLTGFDLAQSLGVDSIEDLYPEEISFSIILSNNIIAAIGLVAGGLSLGLITVFGLIINGLLLGYVLPSHAFSEGIITTLALLVPHGIIEIPALLISAAIGLRIGHMILQRIKGTLIDRKELENLSLVFTFCTILIVLAAFIETYITFWMAENYFS